MIKNNNFKDPSNKDIGKYKVPYGSEWMLAQYAFIPHFNVDKHIVGWLASILWEHRTIGYRGEVIEKQWHNNTEKPFSKALNKTIEWWDISDSGMPFVPGHPTLGWKMQKSIANALKAQNPEYNR